MTVPKQVFITGCYRSGTTLTEKLLHSHPDVSVASQPFPVLLFAAKERFFAHLGLRRRYPIDPQFDESAYTRHDFAAFLHALWLSREDLESILERLSRYSVGLWTTETLGILPDLDPGFYFDVWSDLNVRLAAALGNSGADVVGSKEILGEEFLAPFHAHGGSGVLVIRDPRDMVTSLNIPDRENMTGAPRPILYSLRLWRKSVAYALAADDGVTVIRYEDLVSDPIAVATSITSMLGVTALSPEALAGGLSDQHGGSWGGNSSFGGFRGVSTASVGRFRDRLPRDVIAFIETLVGPEMETVGYERTTEIDLDRSELEAFVEPAAATHEAFEPGYSSDPRRISQELHRLELLRSSAPGEDPQRWFVSSTAFERLRSSTNR